VKYALSRTLVAIAVISATLAALGSRPGNVSAATPKPSAKPTATAAPTPKALPKSVFPVLYNGKAVSTKGFTIYGTPSPAPTPAPTPKPGAVKTPKPMKFAGVETITQIDSYCGGANAGSESNYQFGGMVALPRPAVPCAQPCNSQMKTVTPGFGSTCPIIFVNAKDFFKLIGAKVNTMVTPPGVPDGELTLLYPTPNPSASPTPTPPVPVPTPFQPLAPYYTGSYTVTYCKKLYSGPFFMNKLATDGGKPYIDPFALLNAINADIDTGNLKGISDFTYKIVMPPVRSVIEAGKISGSYQPGPSITINGPISCKAKKPKKSGAYEVEMTSSITTQTHDSQAPATLVAHVSADFVLQKASGTAMVLKLPQKFQFPSTSLLATGTGTLTLDSYSWTQSCDNGKAQMEVSDPVNGSGRMTLLGSAKSPVLVLDTGLTRNSTPSVTASCEGHGANTGPAIWAAGFNAAHIDSVTAGAFYGGFADVGYAIKLEPSVEAGVFTASYHQSTHAGSTSITESTEFTVTKL
jgi:hypothetical protein